MTLIKLTKRNMGSGLQYKVSIGPFVIELVGT